MENRVAMISIVVEDYSAAESVNALLHQFGQYIIGRMGIPYRARKISLISVAIDAPGDQDQRPFRQIGHDSGGVF